MRRLPPHFVLIKSTNEPRSAAAGIQFAPAITHAENVEKASELEPALRRAFEAKKFALVNVTIDKVMSPVAEAAINRKLGSHG